MEQTRTPMTRNPAGTTALSQHDGGTGMPGRLTEFHAFILEIIVLHMHRSE